MAIITIDGRKLDVPEDKNVLQAALDAGIYIPHLCHHPNLSELGSCRMCIVKVEGREGVTTSCTLKPQDGMVIKTEDEEIRKLRILALELLLTCHPEDCSTCPKYGKCELQVLIQYIGPKTNRLKTRRKGFSLEMRNPLIIHDMDRCILCGRCVRACNELRGSKVIDYKKEGMETYIGTLNNKLLTDADCRFCGACVEVCPTGSIMDKFDIMKADRTREDNIVPCRTGCPAHIDIPRYIRHIKNGEYGRATAIIREKVPFPETLGSICTHACETECKRGALNFPISICKLKKSAAVNDDKEWKKYGRKESETGKKIGIIGAGPSGMTAAYYLAKKGHDVTVFEKNKKLGGQCRYGIPSYRLPDELLDREIADIIEAGIKVKTESPVFAKDLMAEGFDSVLIATGTHQGGYLPIPGHKLNGVFINTEFLKRARENDPMPVGDSVMVLGGGNVAYDCARTAVRLGAKDVYVACLESIEKMTATKEEIEEAAEEGIHLFAGNSFLRIVGDYKPEGVELQEVEKFYFDENKKAVIELKEATNHIVKVDTVIFAVGQKPEDTDKMGVELTHGPYIKTDDNLKTDVVGVYASGDVVTGTKSVIAAIAAGRKAAEQIDIYLGGNGDISEELTEHEITSPFIGKIENFAKIDRVKPMLVDSEIRKESFVPVEETLSCNMAKCEANRCLQCDLRLDISGPKTWQDFSEAKEEIV